MRALLILPIAAAIPLMTYLTLEPWLPVYPAHLLRSEQRVFIIGSLAGIPIVYFVVRFSASVFRGRWKAALVLLALTAAATLILAGAWLWFDRKSMAAIEHYDRDGWYVVLLPGAYLAAVFCALGHAALGSFRMVRALDVSRRRIDPSADSTEYDHTRRRDSGFPAGG